MRSINEIIVETLVNKMFEMSGNSVTFQDVKGKQDQWYHQYTMTEDQCYEWMKWGIEYLRTQLKITKRLAEKEMALINLNWGLKIVKQ